MAIEINERTVEDAMAHAEKWQNEEPRSTWLNEPNATAMPQDLVLLADEVLRLRAEVERLERLLKG